MVAEAEAAPIVTRIARTVRFLKKVKQLALLWISVARPPNRAAPSRLAVPYYTSQQGTRPVAIHPQRTIPKSQVV
jgi:hypothetical protein